MDRVVDAEVKKTGDKEVRAKVVNPAGNVGEGASRKGNEQEAIKEALKDADRKGTEKDEQKMQSGDDSESSS